MIQEKSSLARRLIARAEAGPLVVPETDAALRTVLHATVVRSSASTALDRARGRGVVVHREFLAAVAGAGCEREPDPVALVLAATAAASALIDGDAVESVHALGLAASAIPISGRGSLSTADFAERAADIAWDSVLLARAGWDATDFALDGPKGIVAAWGCGGAPPRREVERLDRVGREGFAQVLAERAAGIRWTAMSGREQEAARLTFANAAALIVSAVSEPAFAAAAEVLPGLARRGRILGTALEAPADVVAFVQGSAGHLEDFDDTHLASVVHPGVPIVSAILAASAEADFDGEEALAALIAGVEVAVTVGEMIQDALARGWHMTGATGALGAAAAVSRLLGADAKGIAASIDRAADLVSGTTESLGALAKPLQVGNAARDGLRAALGLTQPTAGRGGLRRLLTMMSAQPSEPAGEALIVDNLIKPYACGVLGHSSIDLALALRRERPGGIPVLCRLRVSPLAVTAMGRLGPRTGLESKFSIVHAVASALRFGDADPRRFDDAAATDAVTVGIRDSIRLVADDALHRFEAHIVATWPDGSTTEFSSEGPRQLTPREVEAKARRLLTEVDGIRTDAFIAAAFAFDAITPAQLLEAASPHR